MPGEEDYTPQNMQRWSMTLCSLLSAATFAAVGSTPAAGGAYASELPRQGARASSVQAAPESEPSALADAAAMLAELPLPPGSSESSTDPPEAGSLLTTPAVGPPGTPNAVDEHAWWLVPATPAEALAYVQAHLPPGTTQQESGNGLGRPNVPENAFSGFTWPGNPGTLVVWVVRLANGSTALRVDAQVVWVTPRPASERIPAGARLLRISVHAPSGASTGIRSTQARLIGRLPSRVISIVRIEKIVALLNELRVQQPGLRHCPLGFGGSVQLRFYTGASAPPLAVTNITAEGCGGVSLTLDGMAEPELEGGWYLVEEISRALGIRPVSEKAKAHHRTHP